MRKYIIISSLVKLCLVIVFMGLAAYSYAQEAAPAAETAVAAAAETAEATAAAVKTTAPAGYFYAIGITMGMGCLAAGFAVGKIGSAVMGAAAEKPEIMGKAIAFVGLGEGIALFAFLISLMLLMKF